MVSIYAKLSAEALFIYLFCVYKIINLLFIKYLKITQYNILLVFPSGQRG